MKKFPYLLFICILLCSCVNNNNQELEAKKISIDLKKEENVSFSFFADSINYIKLETSDEVLISEINKIMVDESKNLYIKDNLNRLFVFNDQGICQFIIDRKGMGPEEYITISNFSLNFIQKRIEILDLQKRKIICYHIDNGTYLESFELGQFVYSIFPINNNYFLADLPTNLSKDNQFGVYLLDSTYQTSKKLLNYSGEYPIFAQDNGVFSEIEESIFGIYSQVENTIYHYKDGENEKAFYIDIVGKKPIKEMRGLSLESMSSDEIENIANILFYKETRSIIALLTSAGPTTKWVFYNKKEDRVVVAENSFNESDFLFLPIKSDSPRTIISKIDSDLAVAINEQNKDNRIGLRDSLYESMMNTKPDDNPIIQIVYLKN